MRISNVLRAAAVTAGVFGLAAAAPGGLVALGEIAFAPTVVRGVDREAERGIAVLDGALDVIVDEGVVAANVQLEDAQCIGRGFRNFLEPGLGDREAALLRRRV